MNRGMSRELVEVYGCPYLLVLGDPSHTSILFLECDGDPPSCSCVREKSSSLCGARKD